jgi:hypothetical protein
MSGSMSDTGDTMLNQTQFPVLKFMLRWSRKWIIPVLFYRFFQRGIHRILRNHKRDIQPRLHRGIRKSLELGLGEKLEINQAKREYKTA